MPNAALSLQHRPCQLFVPLHPTVTYSMPPTTRSQAASSCSPVPTTDDPLPSETTTTTTTTITSLCHEVGVTDTSAINPSTPSPIPVDQHPALIPLSMPNLSPHSISFPNALVPHPLLSRQPLLQPLHICKHNWPLPHTPSPTCKQKLKHSKSNLPTLHNRL